MINNAIIIICLLCFACDAMTNLSELTQDLSENSLLSGIDNITETDEWANPIGNVDEDDWQCQGPLGMVSPQIGVAYPNPFTSSVTISFGVYKIEYVSIIAIDSNAELVENIMGEVISPATYSITWTPFVAPELDSGQIQIPVGGAEPIAPGYYRIQMNTPDFECYGDVHYNP